MVTCNSLVHFFTGSINILIFNSAVTKGPFGQVIPSRYSMQVDLHKIVQGKFPTVELTVMTVCSYVITDNA